MTPPTGCHLVCVPPDKVALAWPPVRSPIFAAMKRGDLSSFGPVEDSVLRGDALLWLALTHEDAERVRIDDAAATELHRTEWRKVCVVVACGAPSRVRPSSRVDASRATDMRRWIRLLEGIEDFARAEGCEATPHHRPQGLGARSHVIPGEMQSAEKDL